MSPTTRTVTTAGTTLATDVAVPESSRPVADVWRGRRNMYFLQEAGTIHRLVMPAGALIHLGVIAILLHANYPTARVIGIAAARAAHHDSL